MAAARITTGGAVVVPAAALFAAMAVLLLPVAAAPSVALLGVALFLVGIPIAPLNALGALRLQASIDPGRQAEGFATFTAAVLIGAGMGQALTGALLAPWGRAGCWPRPWPCRWPRRRRWPPPRCGGPPRAPRPAADGARDRATRRRRGR